ncbi:palmitoyltransferase ZDHHC15B-like [Diabrotica undecimpunctata]|uniref:palmitoyltransferase ZDHHC15B-like n=1 Tax=Diabrotica undecimpunctata TaxID=50387 RepID=UPI003B63275F
MAIHGSKIGRNKWYCKTFKWIPVLSTATLIVWCYYAYVVQLCILTVESEVEKICYLILFHVLFFMFNWSYWKIIFTAAGTVPKTHAIPEQILVSYLNDSDNYEHQNFILENLARRLSISTRSLMGEVRVCKTCGVLKPDRAHHCSVCGVCVLKMDHHCPWINNCVCFTNYKYFILFLGYGCLLCIYVCLTLFSYFIAFWKGSLIYDGNFHILFLFFVSIMFMISLVLLFCYHCYLIIENKTTLEALRPPNFRDIGVDKRGFYIGRYKNIQEVFGEDTIKWFLPIYTSLGNGLEYPLRSHLQPSI